MKGRSFPAFLIIQILQPQLLQQESLFLDTIKVSHFNRKPCSHISLFRIISLQNFNIFRSITFKTPVCWHEDEDALWVWCDASIFWKTSLFKSICQTYRQNLSWKTFWQLKRFLHCRYYFQVFLLYRMIVSLLFFSSFVYCVLRDHSHMENI